MRPVRALLVDFDGTACQASEVPMTLACDGFAIYTRPILELAGLGRR